MPWWVVLVLLLVTNLFTGFVAVTALRHRHVHDFSEWSEWIQDVVNTIYGDVRALRYRTCEGCSKVEGQMAGGHKCLDIYNQKRECTHLTHLTGNETQRVRRLERELGLD